MCVSFLIPIFLTSQKHGGKKKWPLQIEHLGHQACDLRPTSLSPSFLIRKMETLTVLSMTYGYYNM